MLEDKQTSGSKGSGDGQPSFRPHYSGSGTQSDPYIVEFTADDPNNPQNWSPARKWSIASLATIAVFAVTLTSGAYSSSRQQIAAEFDINNEEFAAGISLFVVGFAIGPALWGPLSELYGRRIIFHVTTGAVVTFIAATAGCHSIAELLVFRLLSGAFGASPLTNSGAILSDLFSSRERGLAYAFFSTAPFLGPILGPTFGGFVTMSIGWRWVQGILSIFIGTVWITGLIILPETYAPTILRRIASDLAKKDGMSYITVLEKNNVGARASEVFSKALKRPWVLLFREPIVIVAATYLAIIYATTYMFIPAFPIVYQQHRGWNAGIGGLAFLGIAVGTVIGLIYAIFDDRRYLRLKGDITPESRLPGSLAGAVALPIGLFAFAWTNSPSIHWSASIILSAPFGFGSVMVFLPVLNYLVDTYTIYTASVLSAAAILRALIGAAFPLFTTQLFNNLGIHWASSIPGFLTLACLPFPFVMYKYGPALRMKCKYAAEAALMLQQLSHKAPQAIQQESDSV
ncbi:MFS transporter [Xylariaceae sp. FL1272]|nr:MFS transporter [Xylariaceae sp. FL1272]